MDIAIVGCGITGSAVAKVLERDKDYNIVCFSKNIANAKNNLGRGIEIRKIDARHKRELIANIKNFDLVVNSLPTFFYYRGNEISFNLRVMEACLECGVNYLDMACNGDNKNFIAEQLHLNKDFEKEKLKALINVGASPGLSNLLVAKSSFEMDSIETVKIRNLEEQRGSEFIVSWSKDEMLNVVSDVLIYRNYKFKLKKPFSEFEVYDFSQPFGKLYAYLVSHDEVYTLPHYIKMKNIDVKAAGSDIEVLRTFYRMGLFKEKFIKIKNFRIRPKDFMYNIIPSAHSGNEIKRMIEKGIFENGYFGIFIEVLGRFSNKKVISRKYVVFPSQVEINRLMPGTTYISYPTALCTWAFIKKSFKGKFYGVSPPEALTKSIIDKIFDFLEKRDIIVNEEYKVI